MGLSVAIGLQSQTLDVRMRRRAVVALVALHFTDLNHLEDARGRCSEVDVIVSLSW